jgi:hypothetical protein
MDNSQSGSQKRTEFIKEIRDENENDITALYQTDKTLLWWRSSY